MTTKIIDKSGNLITINTKDEPDLTDRISKNEIANDEVKMIFNNNTVKNANIIALTRPTDSRTEMLNFFFDIEEVLSRKRYDFKTVDDKYEAAKLKNKADDKQSKLETQNEPLSSTGKKNQNLKKVSQKKQNLGNKNLDATDMPDLESEESAAQRRNQSGQELKILIPNQILSGLLIVLAQLQAGNNSEKLKNEIRQLLYFLYRSKKFTKNIYKNLVNII